MRHTSRSNQVTRFARLVVIAALGISASVAQAGIKSERLLAAIIQHTPASTIVHAGEQIKAAEKAAAAIPGAEAMWGVGDSMAPLYTTHTAIVVVPIEYRNLKKGMTVVYQSSRGEMIAHSLTGDLPNGWIAQGVGNDQEDDELVTADNLVGVIVQAYAETNTEYRSTLAKHLIAKGRLAAGQS